MKKLLLISLLTLPIIGFSQARLVFNNGGYINIENNAYLVIDNGAANAVTLLGTGGNILSESETDLVKWNIGANTGLHRVPFTNTNLVKVPVDINITTAGSAGGSLLLSTYRTNNMNLPWPAVAPAVTNMCSQTIGTDASLFVVDRFWRIDGASYGTKPGSTMSFGYDFTNEAGGTNTIIEANLQAQRFNPTTGSGNTPCPFPATPPGPGGNWENILFGTVDVVNNRVNNAVVSSANLFKDWILVDNSTPLPVTLASFDATCEGNATVLSWATLSEISNDYFSIEKSYNAVDFFEIGRKIGAGSSNSFNTYSFIDNNTTNEIAYYRLKQVDFNGQFEYFNIVATNCGKTTNFDVNQVVFSDDQLGLNISISEDEEFQLYLYDALGKIITSKKLTVTKGFNPIQLDRIHLSRGVYMLNIVGEKNHYSTKVFKQ
ncbi:MAG: T9SS type A sorting domain-containing protein [Vicingaceae bacterium]|nr:T9SS type A sorting domain-containing protein [Vicingaceae bacterium]